VAAWTTGIVGAALAEYLGIPHFSIITKVETAADGKSVKCHKPVEGQDPCLESPLPVVITAQKGLNEPRYASLPGIMKAKKKPLDEKPWPLWVSIRGIRRRGQKAEDRPRSPRPLPGKSGKDRPGRFP